MIVVRQMMSEDVAAACRILNEIIEIGGTTANELPFSKALFVQKYLDGSDKICCHVALDDRGEVAGFQWLGVNENLPQDCADIATFARQHPVLKGTGRALFRETVKMAGAMGYTTLNATIRADNAPGLSYYGKMGFQDFAIAYGVPLRDGTPIDRISKRFELRKDAAC